MRGRRLLVTGASGFTGQYVLQTAASAGLECFALARMPDDRLPEGSVPLVADLSDAAALERALETARPDYVIHLAAVSFVAHDNIGEIYRTNVEGTVNLLSAIGRARHDIRRVIIASSANVYGRSRVLPLSTDVPLAPVNHYGVSKASMEHAAGLFSELPLIITRPFNYTGVGQSKKFLVPKIVEAFRRRAGELTLGNLEIARDFSDVRDIASGYIALLERDPGARVVNLCSGAATSLKEIIAKLESLSGHRITISSDPEFIRKDDIPILYGDSTRFDALLEAGPRIGFDDTLKWMLHAEDPAPP